MFPRNDTYVCKEIRKTTRGLQDEDSFHTVFNCQLYSIWRVFIMNKTFLQLQLIICCPKTSLYKLIFLFPVIINCSYAFFPFEKYSGLCLSRPSNIFGHISGFCYNRIPSLSYPDNRLAISGYPDVKKTGIPGTATRLLRSIDDQPEFIQN